jgi:4-amino-4-deoxychorismate lyase
MSLLFETIRLQDGVFQNLEYHNSRLNQSRKAIFHVSDAINLALILHIPDTCRQGIFKCKVIYSAKVEDVYFEPYLPRPVKSLKLITDDTIAYSFKYTNRTHLDKLYAKRGTSDEILIVRNGLLQIPVFRISLFIPAINGSHLLLL